MKYGTFFPTNLLQFSDILAGILILKVYRMVRQKISYYQTNKEHLFSVFVLDSNVGLKMPKWTFEDISIIEKINSL